MKLTRSQLIHAKDVQLAAVGITRSNARGWLRKALAREFTNQEVAQFTFATRTTKRVGKFLLSVEEPGPENVPQKAQVNVVLNTPIGITDDHWLNEERFAWFRKGYGYATTQMMAISALSKCDPGELYHVVTAIMRGAGIKDPIPTPEAFANETYGRNGRDLA